METKLQLLHKSLEDTMRFLDNTFERVQDHNYNGYIYLFIENRRAELIELVTQCFDARGNVNNLVRVLPNEIEKIRKNTLSGLKHLMVKLGYASKVQLI